MSIVGNGAMLGFGLEMHPSLGLGCFGNVVECGFGLEMHPSLGLSCFSNEAKLSFGSEMSPPSWSHVGNVAVREVYHRHTEGKQRSVHMTQIKL